MKTKGQGLGLSKSIFAFLFWGMTLVTFAEVSNEPDQRQSEDLLESKDPLESEESLPSQEPLLSDDPRESKDAQPPEEIFHDQFRNPDSKDQSKTSADEQYSLFDDRMLLEGYSETYTEESKETLLEMIKDDTLNPYKTAAAVRVFRERFAIEVFSKEKNTIEKILLRRFNRTDSPFVEVEIMYTLCLMDRYRYFFSMVPILLQRLDHYNKAVNELAYESLEDIINIGHNRTREARIIFNTLRKTLFLTRRNLAAMKEPTPRLKQKLELLRWSMKVLGSSELKRLPKEVINLF